MDTYISNVNNSICPIDAFAFTNVCIRMLSPCHRVQLIESLQTVVQLISITCYVYEKCIFLPELQKTNISCVLEHSLPLY